jgi:hypothetical protein
MNITIRLDDKDVLTVSNPVYPKLTPSVTNGTGLKNLEARFEMMLDKHIKTENDGITFVVTLPLK